MIDHRLYKNVPGIYRWENKINKKCYIGQSVNLYARIKQHLTVIKNRSHKLQRLALYRAIQKYGLENFDLQIIETFNVSDDIKSILNVKEMYYISKYDSYKNGYNCTLGGDGGVLGYKMTPEQREKMCVSVRKRFQNNCLKVYMYDIHTK